MAGGTAAVAAAASLAIVASAGGAGGAAGATAAGGGGGATALTLGGGFGRGKDKRPARKLSPYRAPFEKPVLAGADRLPPWERNVPPGKRESGGSRDGGESLSNPRFTSSAADLQRAVASRSLVPKTAPPHPTVRARETAQMELAEPRKTLKGLATSLRTDPNKKAIAPIERILEKYHRKVEEAACADPMPTLVWEASHLVPRAVLDDPAALAPSGHSFARLLAEYLSALPLSIRRQVRRWLEPITSREPESVTMRDFGHLVPILKDVERAGGRGEGEGGGAAEAATSFCTGVLLSALSDALVAGPESDGAKQALVSADALLPTVAGISQLPLRRLFRALAGETEAGNALVARLRDFLRAESGGYDLAKAISARLEAEASAHAERRDAKKLADAAGAEGKMDAQHSQDELGTTVATAQLAKAEFSGAAPPPPALQTSETQPAANASAAEVRALAEAAPPSRAGARRRRSLVSDLAECEGSGGKRGDAREVSRSSTEGGDSSSSSSSRDESAERLPRTDAGSSPPISNLLSRWLRLEVAEVSPVEKQLLAETLRAEDPQRAPDELRNMSGGGAGGGPGSGRDAGADAGMSR